MENHNPIYFVPTKSKKVALTFDDGPTPGITDKISSLLLKYNAKGTFFMIGKEVKSNVSLIKEIVASGHSVGTHSYSHKRGMKEWAGEDVLKDFTMAYESLSSVVGFPVVLTRPPFGNVNNAIIASIQSLNMKYVGWSLNSKDWLGGGWIEKILGNIVPGTIVLFHDGGRMDSNKASRSLAMLEILLQWGVDAGYSFVSIPALEESWDSSLETTVSENKKLLGVRVSKSNGRTLVTPFFSSENLMSGLNLSCSFGGEFFDIVVPPMSNIDDWIPKFDKSCTLNLSSPTPCCLYNTEKEVLWV